MSAEELLELQEQLTEAQAEVERLQIEAADSAARAAELEEQNAQLRSELEQGCNAVGAAEKSGGSAPTRRCSGHPASRRAV